MPDFRYQDGEFYCESVPLRKIAEAVGTPCYVYSHATLVRQFRSFDSAFSEVPHLIAYAIKANSNLALLRLLTNEGAGADIVSGGDRKSTRLNSSHGYISYAVFCLKKKKHL